MSQAIDLNPKHHKIVSDILYEIVPRAKVLVFGSRAKWSAKDSSDLDLAIDAGRPLTRKEESTLAEAFDESDLPYKVDVVDLHNVSESFKHIILRDGVGFGWPELSLGDVADFVTDKIAASSVTLENYISTDNMQVDRGGVVPAANLPQASKYNHYKPTDTLFSNIRTYFRKVWLADRAGGASPDVLIFRTKDKKQLNPLYLYYLISGQEFVDFTVLTAKGAKMPRGDKGAMMQFKLRLPSLNEQIEIVEFLRGIDQKIELNQRMNETLEGMARAIFKSWFVDFDHVHAKAEGREPEGMDARTAALFPSTFTLDGLPEGWMFKKLSDVTSELRRGISPKYIEEGGVRVLNQKCIRNGIVSFEPSRRHDNNSKSISGRELVEGDILINSTGVGTLGRVAQIWAIDEQMIVDSHVTVVRADLHQVTPVYLGLNLLTKQNEIEALGEGSTGQTELSRALLGNMDIIIPTHSVLNVFEKLISPIIQKITKNQKQNQTLAALRDTLLPKLISGELRVAPTTEPLKEAVG